MKTNETTQADGKIQCSHCFGDYKLKLDGTMRRHGCARFSQGEWTYGPLDSRQRGAVTAATTEPVEDVWAPTPVRTIPGVGVPVPSAEIVSVTEVQDEVVVTLAAGFDLSESATPAEQVSDRPAYVMSNEPVSVTPEVIAALDTIRSQPGATAAEALAAVMLAFDALDDAGLFDRVDDAALTLPDPGPLHELMALGHNERPTDPAALAAWKNEMHGIYYGQLSGRMAITPPDSHIEGRWSVVNPPATRSTRIPGLRLIHGGAKPLCGKPDPRGYACFLSEGHLYPCMH